MRIFHVYYVTELTWIYLSTLLRSLTKPPNYRRFSLKFYYHRNLNVYHMMHLRCESRVGTCSPVNVTSAEYFVE